MPTNPRYRLLDPIGRGRIGEIHLAEAIDADVKPRQVAVALMDPRITEHEPSFQALQEQVEILERLRHPSIARTLELGWFLEGWGLVMEYARGLDLELYRLAGALPVRVVAEIVEQVSGALTAALELPLDGEREPLGLVHGDLVPSLVRLDAKGGIKVCAFGLAAADGPDPLFAAPERHDDQVSPQGDIYSLGLIMARLLTGRDFQPPPRSAPAHKEFIASVLEAVSKQVGEDIPASMRQAVEPILLMLESMLDFEPRRRPSAPRVQMGCRSMLGVLPGPWLQAWAQARVPDYYEKAMDFARTRDPAAVSIPVDAAKPAKAAAPAIAEAHPFFMDGLFDEVDEVPILTPATISIPSAPEPEEESSSFIDDDEAPTGEDFDDEGPTGGELDDEEVPTGGDLDDHEDSTGDVSRPEPATPGPATARSDDQPKEAPVEEPVEEPEEVLVEEIEEVLVQEPVEEIQEVLVEEPVEEIQEVLIEEPVEEIQEVLVEEPVEEIQEVLIEEPVEEPEEVLIEEPAEEIEEVLVEEPIEEAEEPVEEVQEVLVEEPIEEVEEPVEEIQEVLVEEPIEEV